MSEVVHIAFPVLISILLFQSALWIRDELTARRRRKFDEEMAKFAERAKERDQK